MTNLALVLVSKVLGTQGIYDITSEKNKQLSLLLTTFTQGRNDASEMKASSFLFYVEMIHQ